MGALLRYRQCQERMRTDEDHASASLSCKLEGLDALLAPEALSEVSSKAILSRIGIPFGEDVVLGLQDLASPAVPSYPVVVKVISKDIPHKTEVGGVKVGVGSAKELSQAIQDILTSVGQHAPKAQVDGLLISPMIQDGFEMIVGVIKDQVFGPVVVVGAGGIYTEVLSDLSCRLAPFGTQTAMQMIAELKCCAILQGARGRQRLDVPALANALVLLSHFAFEHQAHIVEIDINPLFVLSKGVVGADALIVLEGKD
jgi:acetyltransferase